MRKLGNLEDPFGNGELKINLQVILSFPAFDVESLDSVLTGTAWSSFQECLKPLNGEIKGKLWN